MAFNPVAGAVIGTAGQLVGSGIAGLVAMGGKATPQLNFARAIYGSDGTSDEEALEAQRRASQSVNPWVQGPSYRRAPSSDSTDPLGAAYSEEQSAQLQADMLARLRARAAGQELASSGYFGDEEARLRGVIASRVAGPRNTALARMGGWEQSNVGQSLAAPRAIAEQQEREQARALLMSGLGQARGQDMQRMSEALQYQDLERQRYAQGMAAGLNRLELEQRSRAFRSGADAQRQRIMNG